MRLRNRSILVSTAAAGFIAVVSTMLPTMASAQERTTAPESAGQGAPYCAMMVGKAPAPGLSSPVLGRACSHSSPEDATRKLNSELSGSDSGAVGAVMATASVRIARLYEKSNYRGSVMWIYGHAGFCDITGYRIDLSDWWRSNLSSVRGDNTCDRARIYDDPDGFEGSHTGYFYLPLAYVGNRLNDDADYVQVHA